MNWLGNFSLLIILIAINGCATIELRIQENQTEQLLEEGRYQEALLLAQQSLILAKKEMGGDETFTTSRVMYELSTIHIMMGAYDKGLFLSEQSLRILEKLGWCGEREDSIWNFQIIANMAACYSYIGAYDKALAYTERMLKFAEKDSASTIRLLNDHVLPSAIATLGNLYKDMGYYDKALPLYERALKITEKMKAAEDIFTAEILLEFAKFYVSIEAYPKALPFYERALRIFEKDQGAEGPRTVHTLTEIGRLYLEMKNYGKAETYIVQSKDKKAMVDFYLATCNYQEALQLLQEIPAKVTDPPPDQVQFYIQKGKALAATGQRLEAEVAFVQAVQTIEDMRNQVPGDKEGFLRGRSGYLRAYRGLYSTLAESFQYNEKLPEALKRYGDGPASVGFYFAEASKARSLLEAMAEASKKRTHSEIPKELREKEENLLNQIEALNDQWEKAYKSGDVALEDVRTRKEQLTGELDHLITELRKSYPAYVALHYPRSIAAKELPLKSNEVLLEYALGDKSSTLFLVKKGGVKKVIPLVISKEALEEKVKSFMDPLMNRQGEGFSMTAAKELYDLLLANAFTEVKKNDEVVIIPDGILGLIPFEVLIDKYGNGANDSRYVGDSYSIHYYQSATVMALQRTLKKQSASKPLFALGNPIFSTEDSRYISPRSVEKTESTHSYDQKCAAYRALSSKEWAEDEQGKLVAEEIPFCPLKETEEEVRNIAKLFGVKIAPPDILLGMDASEKRLNMVNLQDYKNIHFASHAALGGMVQGINEPFILLGQVDKNERSEGFLTLSKVLGLKLNADMVGLSACLTGRGNVIEGEGVANFARAFQYAGAKSVLVSLWEVASEPAVEFMTTFYGYIKIGKSRSESLRLTRNELKGKYTNPFVWGSFILYGEG